MTEERIHASDIPDWCEDTLPCGQLLEAYQENQHMRSEFAWLNEALRKCVMEAADWARQAGEAKGKLEGSEMPGIVDSWKEECERKDAQIARLLEAGDRLVVFARHYPRCAFIRGRDECNCHHGEAVKAWREARKAAGEKP